MQVSHAGPIWIHIPHAYKSTLPGDTFLCLKKSLYGTIFVTNSGFLCLIKSLISERYIQIQNAQCLWLKMDCILFIYVDDCIGTTPNNKMKKGIVEGLIEQLKEAGFELTHEGDFSEYLGINFRWDHTINTMTMTQLGMIKKS